MSVATLLNHSHQTSFTQCVRSSGLSLISLISVYADMWVSRYQHRPLQYQLLDSPRNPIAQSTRPLTLRSSKLYHGRLVAECDWNHVDDRRFRHLGMTVNLKTADDDRQLKTAGDDRQFKAADDDRQLKAAEDDRQLSWKWPLRRITAVVISRGRRDGTVRWADDTHTMERYRHWNEMTVYESVRLYEGSMIFHSTSQKGRTKLKSSANFKKTTLPWAKLGDVKLSVVLRVGLELSLSEYYNWHD